MNVHELIESAVRIEAYAKAWNPGSFISPPRAAGGALAARLRTKIARLRTRVSAMERSGDLKHVQLIVDELNVVVTLLHREMAKHKAAG